MQSNGSQQTIDGWTKKVFKEIMDRSMVITVLKCNTCGEFLARIEYPLEAKLDRSCDIEYHKQFSEHKECTAVKMLIIYMTAADKELAEELNAAQREAFNKFIESFKKP